MTRILNDVSGFKVPVRQRIPLQSALGDANAVARYWSSEYRSRTPMWTLVAFRKPTWLPRYARQSLTRQSQTFVVHRKRPCDPLLGEGRAMGGYEEPRLVTGRTNWGAVTRYISGQ